MDDENTFIGEKQKIKISLGYNNNRKGTKFGNIGVIMNGL